MGKAHVFITDDTLREALHKTIDALRAERDTLRSALKAVEWIRDDMTSYCPWCGGREKYLAARDVGCVIGHTPDCLRQVGLALCAERPQDEDKERAR